MTTWGMIGLYFLVGIIATAVITGYDYENNSWSWDYVRQELRTGVDEYIAIFVLVIGGWFFVLLAIIGCRVFEWLYPNEKCNGCKNKLSRCSCPTLC